MSERICTCCAASDPNKCSQPIAHPPKSKGDLVICRRKTHHGEEGTSGYYYEEVGPYVDHAEKLADALRKVIDLLSDRAGTDEDAQEGLCFAEDIITAYDASKGE